MWMSSCFAFFVLVQCGPPFSSGLNPLGAKFANKSLRNFEADWNGIRIRECVNHRAAIPYQIHNFSQESRNAIYESLETYKIQSCLTFREVDSLWAELGPQFENDTGLYFTPSSFDYPYPVYYSMKGSMKIHELRISENINFDDTVSRAHQQVYYALMGFLPEHTRSDRDQYVTVIWKNIIPGKIFRDLFEIQHSEMKKFAYDFHSISNFYPTDYSKNEEVTLKAKDEKPPLQRNTVPSGLDWTKILARYCSNCSSRVFDLAREGSEN